MARIRSIHPGVFTDEAFMSASAHARLLMIGIWTEAWDDGAFEWKPVVIKARIFPADTCDVAALLAELEALNVLKRVERNGKSYGLIRNFRKFQRPKKPNQSGIVTASDAEYLGPEHEKSEPVRNQFGTSPENPPQMEDGGCKGKKEETSLRSVSGAGAQQAPTPEKPILKPKTNRGTRLAADWSPNERNHADASAIGVPSGQIERLAARFRDYWSAKAGKDGVKLDWDATWRNWCDREAENKGWAAQTFGRQSAGAAQQSSVWVLEDSPAGKAWAEYRKQIKGIPPPWRDDPKDPRRRGWHFPTEFPPVNSLENRGAA